MSVIEGYVAAGWPVPLRSPALVGTHSHVQKTVSHLEEAVFGIIKLLLLPVWKELGKVVLRALLRYGIVRVDEDIGEKTRLLRRDVGEPAAHCELVEVMN